MYRNNIVLILSLILYQKSYFRSLANCNLISSIIKILYCTFIKGPPVLYIHLGCQVSQFTLQPSQGHFNSFNRSSSSNTRQIDRQIDRWIDGEIDLDFYYRQCNRKSISNFKIFHNNQYLCDNSVQLLFKRYII